MKVLLVLLIGFIVGAGTVYLLPLLLAYLVERMVARIVIEIEEETPEDYKAECEELLVSKPLPESIEKWMREYLK